MNIKEYNAVPVFYCKKCLSLKVRSVYRVDNSEYCDECGSTDIGKCTIEEHDKLYKDMYGYSFLSKTY